MPSARFDGCDTVTRLADALELAACDNAGEVFLIGGAELFREGWPLAHKLILTEIDADFPGDISIDAPDAAGLERGLAGDASRGGTERFRLFVCGV